MMVNCFEVSMPKSTPVPHPRARRRVLHAKRALKMAGSAHAYVRGSTVQFYRWLEERSQATVPEGPSVWICGDCHAGNLGPLASADGKIHVQMRDLDQTVIGNPNHDLIRLALSLASAARGSDLPGVTTAQVLEHMVSGYEKALAGSFKRERDKSYRPRMIQGLLERSVRRRWHHLAEERLDTIKPVVPLGKRFWALTDEERSALHDLFGRPELRSRIASLQDHDAGDAIEVVDAAY